MLADPGAKLTNSESAAAFVRDILPGVLASTRKSGSGATSLERFYMIRPATLSTSAATGMPKHAAKAFQNSAWHPPKPFKFEARSGLGSQKIAFDQPSDAQEPPEKGPRGFQSRPNAAKSHRSDIVLFFVLRATCAMFLKLKKTWEKLRFLHIRRFCAPPASVRAKA